MNKFIPETKHFYYPITEISGLTIICKNYNVHFIEYPGSEVRIHYHNNRFRKMAIRKSGSMIYAEEKMAVTFYGFFRFLELMKDNTLEIVLPHGYNHLNISVETSVTNINVQEITVKNMYLTSATGHIHIRNAVIAENLSVNSPAGKIFCQLPGEAADYNIDCRIDRKDVKQPFYPSNKNATKKVSLRSQMYVPDLTFLSN